MSAFSLDEAIKNIRDERAINQLVGSLEKSLERQSGTVQYRNGKCDLIESCDDLTTSANDSQNNVSSLSSITNSANLTKSVDTNIINCNAQSTLNNNHIQHHNKQQSHLSGGVISHQQIFTNFIAAGHQQINNNRSQDRLTNMPKNEPVKLAYPTTQASNIVTMNNNRVTFTTSTAPVQNGTITLSPMTANQLTQPNQQQQATVMQRAGQQAPTLIFKNATSSAQGTLISTPVTVTKANSQGNQSNIVALPSNLLVNIRPQTATGAQNAQKTTVGQQRVVNVINQPMVRPQSNTFIAGYHRDNTNYYSGNQITLSGLPQNVQGNTILLKQDNGSYQLLRISTQPGAQVTPGLTPTAGSTIRLQTVPASSIAPSSTILVSTSSAPNQQQQQQILTTQSTPVVSVSQVPALTTTHTHQVQSQPTPTVVVQQTGTNSSNNTAPTGGVVVTQSPAQRNDNAKEKCRKFLTNLIDLSKREPAQVEMNVKTLIQELVDANVGPEDFCKKLENLLNAAPQPCLVGFLKRSLPLLRQSLVTKETVIEGINPPSPSVAFSGATITTTQIPAQIRPIGQTMVSGIGQTQIRMVQHGPRIGQTTIRPTTPQQIVRTATPAMRPLTTIRGQTTIVQTQANNQQVPALHPVSGTTIISSGTAQIRSQASPNITRPQNQTSSVQIRPTSTQVRAQKVPSLPNSSSVQVTKSQASTGAQLKQIVTNNNVNINNNNNTKNNNKNQVSIAVVSTINSTHVTNSKPSTTSPNKSPTKSNAISNSHPSTPTSTTPTKSPTFNNNKPHHENKKSQGSAQKAKDKKTSLASVVAATASSGSGSNSISNNFFPTFGDDDINDVAAMGGVNLAEESQKILGSTEFVGTQIRSCKDEVLLNLSVLQQRIRQQMARHGLDEPSTDVAVLISHATQEHLKNIIEKLAVIAEHRIDILKMDPRYEMTTDVRGQIKFLEELDKAEQKRHEEVEREMLLRAAKSRSKTEDPEQAKLKAKAKEMQRAELEEMRHREANNTALQAIGTRKRKIDSDSATSMTGNGTNLGSTPMIKTTAAARPRIKRVNMRDMIFYMEQEKDTCRSTMLYKAYLK
ncbi:transcription initiation factor TFIID subunit 4 isoform X3 [Chironomus tepperi]|uniref:transcription initiation factor TFIID subunit 4 isoform X3 n=1 Tax=Chironomus tepperi TaxID=113505 RepID=UPI00391F505D